MSEDLAIVSHEQDGRVLSGVGASADDLAEVMDRHSPAEEKPAQEARSKPVDTASDANAARIGHKTDARSAPLL